MLKASEYLRFRLEELNYQDKKEVWPAEERASVYISRFLVGLRDGSFEDQIRSVLAQAAEVAEQDGD